MNELWFEEELIPLEIDTLNKGKNNHNNEEIQRLELQGSVRQHVPRHRNLTAKELGDIKTNKINYSYVLVKLGCEFDPGEYARKRHIGFAEVNFTIYLWGERNLALWELP